MLVVSGIRSKQANVGEVSVGRPQLLDELDAQGAQAREREVGMG